MARNNIKKELIGKCCFYTKDYNLILKTDSREEVVRETKVDLGFSKEAFIHTLDWYLGKNHLKLEDRDYSTDETAIPIQKVEGKLYKIIKES
jgi:hypothetical protein